MANNKTISELEILKKNLDILIIEKDNPNVSVEKLTDLSNKLQEKIYEYRKNSFLIPDLFYYINRNKQEILTTKFASIEKQQYEDMNNS